MSDLARLYQASILEHHKHPRGAGRLEEPTHTAAGHNPLCGDRLTITAQLAAGSVTAVRCDASGCAICRASGSMLTEAVTGRGVTEVCLLIDRFLAVLASTEDGAGQAMADAEWGPLAALLQVRHFPGRRGCATLSWETLRRAVCEP